MAKRHGGQKFIGRNRDPRVQIECDEECYGAQIKVQLPFIMGVMADLSGKWEDFAQVPGKHRTTRGELEERKFLEIDVDNFTERMEAMNPTVSFTVPNTFSGDGNFGVNLSFKRIEDFEPHQVAAQLAEKLEPVKEIYDLSKTLRYLKDTAPNNPKLEKVLQEILKKPELARAYLAAAQAKRNTKA